jgi:hypothetical protein
MNKNNPRRDVHMYKTIPNAKKLFLWLQLLEVVVHFHLEPKWPKSNLSCA